MDLSPNYRLPNYRILHFQTYSAHQRKRIAFLDDTGVETVIEDHLAILQFILEMKIRSFWRERVGESGERKIVCCDKTNCAAVDQTADDGFCPDRPIVGIRAMQDFIQLEKHRHLFRELHDVP